MKRILQITSTSILAAVLISASAASGQSLSLQAKETQSGRWMTELSTYAGTGEEDFRNGNLLEAAFRQPDGLAVSENGGIWVADSRNNVIRKLENGKVTVFAGANLKRNTEVVPIGAMADGAAELSLFDQPSGIARGPGGSILVADTGNHAVRSIGADGVVTTLAGNGLLGYQDGVSAEARFAYPRAVAAAADGTIYVADTLNHVIRKLAPDGKVTTLNAPSTRLAEIVPGLIQPSGDYADGPLAAAKFNEPSGLAIDSKGNLYVSDSGNNRIRYIDMASGIVTTVAGGWVNSSGYNKASLYADGGYADGAAHKARFAYPTGISVTSEGGLLIADTRNHSIRYLKDGTVRTLAGGELQQAGLKDGIEGYGTLHQPRMALELPGGAVLVSDSFNSKLRTISFWGIPKELKKDGKLDVVFNGQILAFDAKPELTKAGRTMIPVRAVAEALGYEVTFDPEGQKVGLTNGSTKVEMAVGNKTVYTTEVRTSKRMELIVDTEPYIKENRTYVPIRFFAESLNLDVQWDAATETVILRTKQAGK